MQLRQDSVPNSPTGSNNETADEELHDDNSKDKKDDEKKEDIEGDKSEDKEVNENIEVEKNKEVDKNKEVNKNKELDENKEVDKNKEVDENGRKDLLKVSYDKITHLFMYFDMYCNVLNNDIILNLFFYYRDKWFEITILSSPQIRKL